MRKYAVALLAIPILLPILAAAVLRRSLVARTGVGIGIGAAVALAAIGLVRPPATDAIPPSTTIPLTQAAFQSRVNTDVEVDAPVTITFNSPMDRASVQASITVEPSVPVSYTWSGGDTVVAVAPVDHWAAGSYYTITVNPGALARSGRPSTSPARALFFTRSAPTAKIAVPARLGARVSVSPMFTIGFDRTVEAASVTSGVHLVPAAAVQVRLVNDLAGAPTYAVTPTAPLAPDTVYRLVVDGVRDAHGATVTAASLMVRTIRAARVVRFRPVAKSTNVARDVAISVRFTEAMDPASTRKAFTVTAAGAPVAGSVRFAEGSTVLVLVPKTALPYGAKIVATVGTGAKTRSGVPIAAAASATFQTVAKPAAKVAGKPVVKIPRPSGGGSVGSGSWGAVERYYLTLMNCTRTGGWVTSSGSCSSPGGRNVAPLTLSSSISTLVSRPYAKRIAMSGDCSHFIGGNPGDRLRHAGFMSYKWAENIGCRQGSPSVTALAAQLFFQSEKPYNGGHYVNMMNAMYDRVGIGIWLYSGRTRLVIDFYHP